VAGRDLRRPSGDDPGSVHAKDKADPKERTENAATCTAPTYVAA
jgi:hypothetical protein